MNDLGFTHLSVAVDDMGAALARVRPAGGEILEDTDMGGRAVMIRDPDGQLIELTTFGFRAMWPPWPDGAAPPRQGSGTAGVPVAAGASGSGGHVEAEELDMLPPMILRTSSSG